MGFVYFLVAAYLSIIVRIFFRRVVVLRKSNVPEKGGIILCGNHPNALIDPIVVVATSPRLPSFLAKSGLFKVPVLGALLRATGTLPVYRRQDFAPLEKKTKGTEKKDVEKGNQAPSNDSMFRACHERLVAGGAIALFPEGVSTDVPFLHELKTGAARIALGAADLCDGEQPISLIPVGLYYTHADKFRSTVFVEYGDPIRVDKALLESWRDPGIGFQAARDLTQVLEEGIRSVTVVAEEWKTIELAHTARRLYVPPEGVEYRPDLYTEWTRRFVKGYERATAAKDRDMAELVDRLQVYQDGLDALGVKSRDVQRGISTCTLLTVFFYRLILILLGLPISAVAIVLHLPVILWCHFEGNKWRARDKRENVSTFKIIIAAFLVPLLYIAEIILIRVVSGLWWVAVISIAVIPFSLWVFGLIAELEVSIFLAIIGLGRMVTFQSHVAKLKEEGDLSISKIKMKQDGAGEKLQKQISLLVERWREGGGMDQKEDMGVVGEEDVRVQEEEMGVGEEDVQEEETGVGEEDVQEEETGVGEEDV